jgi:4-hydroxybenzoyl-CoA thioesterase
MAGAYTQAVTGPAEESHGVHRHPVSVRWGDCDPAGIVYYPRFFDFFHQAMETWFADGLGSPYADVIVGRKIGFPSVHVDADFRRPSAFGDPLVVELRVVHLGTKSIRFTFRVLGAGEEEPRVTGSKVCVVMDLDPDSDGFRTGLPVPDDLRAAVVAFGVSE